MCVCTLRHRNCVCHISESYIQSADRHTHTHTHTHIGFLYISVHTHARAHTHTHIQLGENLISHYFETECAVHCGDILYVLWGRA